MTTEISTGKDSQRREGISICTLSLRETKQRFALDFTLGLGSGFFSLPLQAISSFQEKLIYRQTKQQKMET